MTPETITLVGSENRDGSRTITTAGTPETGPILYSVDEVYLKDYVPNAGDDRLIRAADGSIRFERSA